MQGGIIADACNNVFIGDANGTIKVYHFDGINFDDAVNLILPYQVMLLNQCTIWPMMNQKAVICKWRWICSKC